ncbi:tyrosine-type recombinase/integrase [Agrobacterium pusense]|uniref:Tyrosine-type recombinase/integrase n=1 Tax=Agrobacterium pusense TaxID=648995 RepID=A0AA44EML5_9HYPH|nr:site-specific integrase [Agrobacterium pusense]NRF10926.1 tyrosine-type recombinase/integrase [Agrobacterium pusense]NRF21636.1 tyrosine-type recombinase/integrase [Agrobacterium pusense]PZU76786.1 MAG: integrase [Rhizobium sp.]HCJ70406.1 integrase [Agrobacterium sp.]
MATVKLTKTEVDGAEPREKAYVLFDSKITGFGLRVFPTGTKTWILEYRANGGGRKERKKKFTIGNIKDFTADEARKVAEKKRAEVVVGLDPQAEKAGERAAITVKELSKLFFENHVEPKRSKNTKEGYRDALDSHILPALGNMKADKVVVAEVERLHNKLSTTPSMANKVLAVVSSMYSYGMTMKHLKTKENPAQGIEKFKETEKERFLSTEELIRLEETLSLAESIGLPWNIDEDKQSKHLRKDGRVTVFSPYVTAAIRLLMLTGARLREILELEWSIVDLSNGVLKLSKSKSAGEDNGKKDIILSQPAIEILKSLPRIGKYVIASESAGTEAEKPRADIKKPWARACQHANLPGVRLHDLRHTFASHGVNEGLGIAVVSKLLGHKDISTTMRYAHFENEALKQGANRIGKRVRGKRVLEKA